MRRSTSRAWVSRMRPESVRLTPRLVRLRICAPSARSRFLIRMLAAATEMFASAAPCVRLRASATRMNSIRSNRSKCRRAGWCMTDPSKRRRGGPVAERSGRPRGWWRAGPCPEIALHQHGVEPAAKLEPDALDRPDPAEAERGVQRDRRRLRRIADHGDHLAKATLLRLGDEAAEQRRADAAAM